MNPEASRDATAGTNFGTTTNTTDVAPQHVAVIGSLAWSLVNFRFDLMQRMVANGHRVTALAPDFDEDTRARLNAAGIACEQIAMQRTGVNPLADLGSLLDLVRTLRALRPDVVLGYTMKPILYGCWAAAIAGVPRRYALFTGLGYAFSEARPRGRRRWVRAVSVGLHRIALRKVTGAFCYNIQERKDIRGLRLVPDAVPLIDVPGSGVDTKRFRPAESMTDPVQFLFVGRLLRSKGLAVLAEAAKRLRAQGKAFDLAILGPTDTNPDAISPEELAQWETDGLMRHLGATRDVRPYFDAAGVFVLPTMLREGVPRTILEAMASGLPVITTDAPGCGETVVPDVSGLVVPQGDAQALAAAMARLIDDPDLRRAMGEAARRRVCERHDVHLINALLLTHMGLEAPVVPSGAQAEPETAPRDEAGMERVA